MTTPPWPQKPSTAADAADRYEQSEHAAASGDSAIWISRFSQAQRQEKLNGLGKASSQSLYGLSFAVKDNIDVKGLLTTAACPAYGYMPGKDAPVVRRLMEAGALPLGKSNLDQFATGLVGVRSPYGIPENPYHADYVPGGSSSGSAVAVAREQVDFSLGTDTAGSGRVPAGFNNLVGLKPSRGLLSTRGVVPACRSLDCVSIFTRTAAQARSVFEVAAAYDPLDPWSRRERTQRSINAMPVIGVPRSSQLDFSKNAEYARLFAQACERMSALGWQIKEVDISSFVECAELLYEGPWVAERTTAIEAFLLEQPDSLHPVTRGIIEGGFQGTAVDFFKARYRLEELRRECSAMWEDCDVLLTPTTPTHYTVAEVEADPVACNSHLGLYTNWMNLLDLCAIALPSGFTEAEMPFGITLQAPALFDEMLLQLGEQYLGEQAAAPLHSEDWVSLAVCGAHLEGLPLNYQLSERGAKLSRKVKSAPAYQFIALTGEIAKPGMIRLAEGGVSVDMEIWDMPLEQFGSFVNLIPAPLGIGTVELEDGGSVKGFVCEAIAAQGAEDISHFGSWRAYLDR